MTQEWMEKYKIGNLNVDDPHIERFQLASSFLFAIDLQAKHEAGNAFRQFTRQHFTHEETTTMRDTQFSTNADHVEKHIWLSGTLNQILDFAGDDTLSKTELEEFVGYS